MMSPPRDQRLAVLMARLRAAGWEPTAEEVADALWLAQWTGSATRPGTAGDLPGADPPEPPPAADPGRPPAERPRTPEPHGSSAQPQRQTGDRAADGSVSLFAEGPGVGGRAHAFPVRAPAAAALPGLLGLQRALRPLRRYRPLAPPTRRRLDEEATADRSARAGVLRPVFRPVERWDIDIQLLLDSSPSMVVWERMFQELRQVCEQLGVFRDVQAHYLHRGEDGTPQIGTAARARDGGRLRLRPAGQFRDPTGRRLTLVISDCVGPLWREGSAQRLLHRWLSCSPVALVQPLPPRLWHRTGLPAATGLLTRDRSLGTSLGFRPESYGPGRPPDRRALPVPVLLPTAPALGTWAGLLSRTGPAAVRGAAAWVRPDHPPAPPPRQEQTARKADELVRAFAASASPGARRLAVHLAAAPTTLPVMQVVQRAVLPDTGPMELAEVLLGGLLWQVPGPGSEADLPAEVAFGPWYEFADGVQEILLHSLDQDAAALVLKRCSAFMAQHFGKGTRNFFALAAARLADTAAASQQEPAAQEPERDEPAAAESALFAEVPARVVRWFQPAPSVEGEAGPVGKAEDLLRMWQQQRDPVLLEEARTYAEEALAAETAPGERAVESPAAIEDNGVRSRLVLGRVLLALCGTRTVRHTAGALHRTLERAVAVLTEAVARTEPGTERHTHGALELAAAHYAAWRAGEPSAHLAAAEEVLRALSPTGLAAADRRTRHLRLGRVLLAGAGAAQEPHSAADAAAEAVTELRAACDQSTSGEVPDVLRAGALVDLAEALRLAGDRGAEVLDALDRADRLADGDEGLHARVLPARARALGEAGRWAESDAAYAAAADLAPRDSLLRGELLAEWSESLLRRGPEAEPEEAPARDEGAAAQAIARAEGVLREASATVPSREPLFGRLQLLLGRTLLLRYRQDQLPPDLYEGVYLLEQAARRSADPAVRIDAWLELGAARMRSPDSPNSETTQTWLAAAAAAYAAALQEARAQGEAGPGSVAAARALHGRGVALELMGSHAAALAAYEEAAREWQRLASLSDPVPWPEVEATRARIAELTRPSGAEAE
ncbi:SAV_2336 N-terminal domain-related protein [Streptomyces sp. HNM0663]|uniref:SAV_2336 N-terminal domain-related protein n=1 Tax=Streptomyces chengmaiensis TaxID=3040919 RepID=A0ABT6HF03_9ACTN|nr:SAV_2336 N-terminal domain-related protein [Streptomyces chengmaiensis]MDH2387233.1 SAV_2336 N-terminal domain-related protein [Streptomyces chengmaiensis]